MTPQQAHQQAAAIGDDALSRQHRTNTGGSLANIAGAVSADLLPRKTQLSRLHTNTMEADCYKIGSLAASYKQSEKHNRSAEVCITK